MSFTNKRTCRVLASGHIWKDGVCTYCKELRCLHVTPRGNRCWLAAKDCPYHTKQPKHGSVKGQT